MEIIYNKDIAINTFGKKYLTKMCVILISGKPGSGKTSLANSIAFYLKNLDFHVLRTSFATEVKVLAKQYFDWNGEKDETGRKILQGVGMLGRHIDASYWVNLIMAEIVNSVAPYDFVVIDDLRFLNELRAFEQIDNIDLITIRRNSEFQENNYHVAESSMDSHNFDVEVNTKGKPDVKEADIAAKDIIRMVLENLDNSRKRGIL